MPSRPTSRHTRSPSPPAEATDEVTSLLPPSRPRSPTHSSANGHNRKVSASGRSVAGSVRGYGAVSTRVSPTDQAPRVSKLGQRRVLTTIPIQLAFLTLVILEFLALVLTLILFINTATDLTVVFLPYRGSGFVEFWVSAIGAWIGLGGVLFFSHPSSLYFITTLLTTVLLLPVFLLSFLNPALRRAHHPLLLVPLVLTAVILLVTLLNNWMVRRARWKESQRIRRMITDAAAREHISEERMARAAVGIQRSGWSRITGFFAGILGLIAGLLGLILVTLLLIDLSINAYDSSIALPSNHSQILSITPPHSSWPIKIHLACRDPPKSSMTALSSGTSNITLPTILYEPSSGVPGSLALLETPLPPASTNATNPGRWLFDLQEKGHVGRICVWDRPGYGFSEVLGSADLGRVSDALYMVLDKQGEIKSASKGSGFLLVGEGYGGLLTRVFASRHPKLVHSILHLDAQTAQTYFSEYPNGFSVPGLALHRFTTRLLPSIITPLSLRRFPSVLFRRSSSLSRILASPNPKPNTVHLNENLRKARLQETFGSHSHTSRAFRALLESGRDYPSNTPAIVISSKDRMDKDKEWAEGQKGLAKGVTSAEGLVDWIEVSGVGRGVCTKRGVCEDAVKKLIMV